MLAALTHDLAELHTGDMPYPFKYANPQLKEYLDDAECTILASVRLDVLLTPEETLILKAADMLDLALKCVDEVELGNQTVLDMLNTGILVLRGLQLPAGPQGRLNQILEGLVDESK